MKLTLCAIGSRGDVVPMLALGRALMDLGSDVVVAASPEFAAEAAEAGLEFRPIAPEVLRNLAEGSSAMGSQSKVTVLLVRQMNEGLSEVMDQLSEIAIGSQAIIATGLVSGAPHVAEALGIAYRNVVFCPRYYPSANHPICTDPAPRRSKLSNKFAWWGNVRSFDMLFGKRLNQWRRDHALQPASDLYGRMYGRPGERVLVADEMLAPLPPDVVGTRRVSAIMPLQRGHLAQEVEQFLASGEPPVYVGFGSMPAADADRLLDVVLESAAALQVRTIVPAAWAEAASRPIPDDCRAFGHVPHHLLFPRVAAVVHHGGAGTTSAAARAGVPQVVVPHLVDQYYWGDRVHKLGVAPRPLAYKRLSSRSLTSALREAIGSQAMAGAAGRLSGELSGQRDGAEELAELLVDEFSSACVTTSG